MTGYRTVKGVMHVTVAVPFRVTIHDDDGAPTGDSDALAAWFNGDNPDALEGAEIEVADASVHEVIAAEVEAAWLDPNLD